MFAWVGERYSQAYHQLEKMQDKNILVALSLVVVVCSPLPSAFMQALISFLSRKCKS